MAHPADRKQQVDEQDEGPDITVFIKITGFPSVHPRALCWLCAVCTSDVAFSFRDGLVDTGLVESLRGLVVGDALLVFFVGIGRHIHCSDICFRIGHAANTVRLSVPISPA